MRVALVHDWLVAQRGGENVLLELARALPGAPIFTLVHRPGAVDAELERHPIVTSFVQGLPGAPRRFRQYLPLFPAAVARWDLSPFDLVISSSHCVAQGVRTSARQFHLAYVHTPMRYLYDQLPHYVPTWPSKGLWVGAARLASAPLRHWDVQSATRADVLVANSDYVARRIARVWGRQAQVVYPPVDVDFFAAVLERARHGLLVVSALVPYKRVDLAVQFATRHGLPLTVVGEGPERGRLRALAGATVQFVPTLSRSELRDAYAGAEALLFCGVEDFGMVPVEAMASGCPVLAFADGGALETVVDADNEAAATGVLFAEPTLSALERGWRRLRARAEAGGFRGETLRAHAARFGRRQFLSRLDELLRQHSVQGVQLLQG
ncbi:MAG: glycosyltransferase [Myxococcota bacterium]